MLLAAALLIADPSGWTLVTSEESYAAGIDTKIKRTGASSGVLRSENNAADGWAQLLQVIRGNAFKGKRVRFRAYLKTDAVIGRAGLFMRVEGDNSNQPLAWDNMQDRPIRGSTNWQRVAVVLDIPVDSKRMLFGLLLTGKGKVWIDDVSLDVVDETVPVTDIMHRWPHPERPENLDFERAGPVLDPSPTEESPIPLVVIPQRS